MMTNKDSLRHDDLIWGGFKLYQDTNGFCFSLDAVILACFFNTEKCSKIIDIGTGNGVLPLLIKAKSPESNITALEINKKSAQLAQLNIRENNVNVEVICGDAMKATTLFNKNLFDAVISNPPYYKKGHCRPAKNQSIALAKTEIAWESEEFFHQCNWLLKDKGTITLAYPPLRLEEISALAKKYGFSQTRRLWLKSKAKKNPYLVVLEYIKGYNSTEIVEEILIIHGEDGEYSPELKTILKEKAWRN